MTLVIVSLNAAGWGIYFLAIQPRHFHYQGLGIGLGVAIPASPN
jgi:high-affinity nickel-transport protein